MAKTNKVLEFLENMDPDIRRRATADDLYEAIEFLMKLAEEKEKEPKVPTEETARDMLRPIAKVWQRTGKGQHRFVENNLSGAVEKVAKAFSLGYDLEDLELAYIPSRKECGSFWKLIQKYNQAKGANGYPDYEEYIGWDVWEEKAEEFGQYGIGDEAHFEILIHNPDGLDGLFFLDKSSKEQKRLAEEYFAENPGTTYASPAARWSARLTRVANSEGLLGEKTWERYLQYGDESGFIKDSGGDSFALSANVNGDGRADFNGSRGYAYSDYGVALALE